MADDSKQYDIKITTQYDGSGAAAARADLEQTGASAAGGGASGGKVNYSALAAERAAAEKTMAAASAETLAVETQKTIEQEKQVIVATRRAMLEATIAGDATELAKLRAELAVRQLTIQTLQTESMTQVELNAFLTEQNILIEQGAAAAVVAAEANAASASALGYREVREAAHAYHGLETAMSGGSMSARTLTMSMRGLYELLLKNPWIATVTAIGAVVIALGEFIKKSAEAREKVIEDIKEISKKNAELAAELEKKSMEAKFDSLKESLAGVKTAYDEATKATREYYATEREKGDIEAATKRHENEEKERKELEGAQGDPVKEAEIKKKWAETQVNDQQANEERKAKLAVEEAQKNAEDAKKAVEKNEAEKAKAESAAQADTAAFEETKTRVASAAAKVGVKSNEQTDLDRLEELRGMSEARRGTTGNEELYKLELSEKETRRKAAESPTFRDKKTWVDALNGEEAPDEEITRLASRKKEFEDNINRAKSWGDKDNQAMWESQLSKATAAETLRKELPMLAERKKKAEEAEAKQKAASEAAEKQAKELTAQQKEAQDKLMLAELNQTKVDAAKTSTVAKTRTDNTKRVQAAELEEQKKAHEAKVKEAESALEGAKNTAADYDEKVDAVAKLKAGGVGMRLPGTKPTQAEAELEAADKGKITADAQKRKSAAADARKREAERQRQEREKEKNEWEKAGGPEVERLGKNVGVSATSMDRSGFNSAKALAAAGENLAAHPAEIEAQGKLREALQTYASHADQAGIKRAEAMMQTVRMLEAKTRELDQKTERLQQGIKEHSY